MTVEAWSFIEMARRSRLPLLLTDPESDQQIVYANNAFLELTGYDLNDVIGWNCRFLQGPGTDPEAVQRIRRAISEGTEFHGEILNYRKDGSEFWNELFMTPIFDDEGRIAYFLGSQLDVTARIRARDAVRATRDELAARLAEREHLVREIQHRVRNNLQLLLSIVRIEAAAPAGSRPWHDAITKRILALAAAHVPPDADSPLSSIDVGVALASLVSLVASEGSRVSVDAGHMSANIDVLVPLVLIAGEMLYAMREGEIELSIRPDAATGSVMLRVGPRPMPAPSGECASGAAPVSLSGTGLTITTTLAGQLGGILHQESHSFLIEFPSALFDRIAGAPKWSGLQEESRRGSSDRPVTSEDPV
jgi:PAS domain S-box-containing protein